MDSEEERPPASLCDFRRPWGAPVTRNPDSRAPCGALGSDGKAIRCWAPGSLLLESQKLWCLISDTGDEDASASHWKGSLKKLLSPLPMKVKVAQLCPTLCDSHTVHGILQARILEWVVIPFSRGSSQKLNLGLLHCRQVLYQLSYKGTPLFPWWKSNSTSPADTVIKTASSGTHPDHITVLPVPPAHGLQKGCLFHLLSHSQLGPRSST